MYLAKIQVIKIKFIILFNEITQIYKIFVDLFR